jgi:hypothetical protein
MSSNNEGDGSVDAFLFERGRNNKKKEEQEEQKRSGPGEMGARGKSAD